MKKETIQRLIDEYIQMNSAKGVASHIASVLDEEKILKKDIQCYLKNEQQEKERHALKLKELQKTLSSIQNRCPHYEYTFYSDDYSNNSYNSCDLCGKEW